MAYKALPWTFFHLIMTERRNGDGDDSLILQMRWQRDKEHRILPPGMCKCTVGTWASVSCPLGALLNSHHPTLLQRPAWGYSVENSKLELSVAVMFLSLVKCLQNPLHLLTLSETCMPHSLKSHPVDGSYDTAIVYCWARALEHRYLANKVWM